MATSTLVELIDVVIRVGLNSRKTDVDFCAGLKENYSYVVVHHGDASFMRLSSRFYFEDNTEYYTFVKLDYFDEEMEEALGDLLAQLPLDNDDRLLRLVGPPGVGKSFFLQYIVRHIRIRKHLRCFHLANPEIFLDRGVNYFALLAELVYSVAQDFDEALKTYIVQQAGKILESDDTGLEILKETFQRVVEQLEAKNVDEAFRTSLFQQASTMLESKDTGFRLFKETFQHVVNHLQAKSVSIVIALDQEDAYENLNGNALLKLLTEKNHGVYVLSTRSCTGESMKIPVPSSHLIKLLSDQEILAILKSRCSAMDRCGLAKNEDYVERILSEVLSTVGRCPLDIHEMMNYKLEDEDFGELFSTSIELRCRHYKPDYVEVADKHQSFFEKLEENQKIAFSILLKLAGKAPPIDSRGYFRYEYIFSEVEGTPTSPSHRLTSEELQEQIQEMHDDIIEFYESVFSKPYPSSFESNREVDDDSGSILLKIPPEDTISTESPNSPNENCMDIDTVNTTESPPLCEQVAAEVCRPNEKQSTISTQSLLAPLEEIEVSLYHVYESENPIPVHDEDSSVNESEDYRTIEVFKRIPDYEMFSSVGKATQVLDGRYFYIDEKGYVRPYSEPAFRAIKSFHRSPHSSFI